MEDKQNTNLRAAVERALASNFRVLAALQEMKEVLQPPDGKPDHTHTAIIANPTVQIKLQLLLGQGEALTRTELAEETAISEETIRKTISRHRDIFTVLEDGRISLRQTV